MQRAWNAHSETEETSFHKDAILQDLGMHGSDPWPAKLVVSL